MLSRPRPSPAGKPHFIEIQGASYEGYTVWINAMIASAGGRVLSENGQQVVLGPAAAKGVSVVGQLACPRRPTRRWGCRWRTRTGSPSRPARPPSRSTTPSSTPPPSRTPPPSPGRWAGPSTRGSTRRCPRAPGRRHRPGRQRLQPPQAAGLRRHHLPAQLPEPAPQRGQGRPAAHPGQPQARTPAHQRRLPVRGRDPRLPAARRRPSQDAGLPVGLHRHVLDLYLPSTAGPGKLTQLRGQLQDAIDSKGLIP